MPAAPEPIGFVEDDDPAEDRGEVGRHRGERDDSTPSPTWRLRAEA
jgi:hypothetical protein